MTDFSNKPHVAVDTTKTLYTRLGFKVLAPVVGTGLIKGKIEGIRSISGYTWHKSGKHTDYTELDLFNVEDEAI